MRLLFLRLYQLSTMVLIQMHLINLLFQPLFYIKFFLVIYTQNFVDYPLEENNIRVYNNIKTIIRTRHANKIKKELLS